MFGNLSKNLIKAPHYFNTHYDEGQNNNQKELGINLIDVYSNLRKIKGRNNIPRYFKEKDYVKKHLRLDLNYNNNFRKEINPKVRTNPCLSFEELFFGNSKNDSKILTKQSLYKTKKSNITNNTNNTNKLNFTNGSNLTKSYDSKKTPHSTRNEKLNKFLDKNLLPKNSVEIFNEEVESNINSLIGKINHNSLNFKEFEKKNDKKGKNTFENLKEYINKNTVVEKPIKLKFPEICVKSNDTLYREAMDKKINSLSILSPKIKEQLKGKHRVFASGKDFYRYNNSYAMYKLNPFYESVKYLEENKKNEMLEGE